MSSMSEWICSVTEKNSHEWMMVAKQELVRCKGCRHRSEKLYQHGITHKDVYVCQIHDIAADTDWFCADGEKE